MTTHGAQDANAPDSKVHKSADATGTELTEEQLTDVAGGADSGGEGIEAWRAGRAPVRK